MTLNWTNHSSQNPGHSVYAAAGEIDTNVQYVIRRKRKTAEFNPTNWRLYMRNTPSDPLRMIYDAPTKSACQDFANQAEELRKSATIQEPHR